MQSKDDIKSTLKENQDTLNEFLAGLSDEDLALRRKMGLPVPTADNIAWQMGHLITSEVAMGAAVPGASYPELPAGMKEAYGRNARLIVPPVGYLKKAEYLEWFNKVRSATLAALDRLTEADLDKPTLGPMAPSAPTVGALLWHIANHTCLTIGGLRTFGPEAL
jgi:DinB superfamily